MSKFYVTTPIYYVNDSPHIGHSYTTIAADTLARHMRSVLGDANVRFLTGTDEHGQKAQAAGQAAQEFVDLVSVKFRNLWKKLGISHDDFIRTSEERHIRTVQRALDIVYKKGDIYKDTYEGWYCTPCETFWLVSQLAEGQLCPDCKRPVEKISETNYFFKLNKYKDWLIDHIKKNPDFIRPQIRRNEVLGFLREELNDLCISRPKERLSWGIPLPFSPDHVTYVWFDALINYISAVGHFDDKGAYISDWWGKDTNVVHLIGKDILRHHAVYWPIMLHSLGIKPPDTICAHGWWMIGADKMSKSRGNVVAPLDMIDKYGLDVYRYFLLREVPFGLDGNFSEEAVIRRLNSDLANDLGNLVYRTLTMIEKYYDGNIPAKELPVASCQLPVNEQEKKIRNKINSLPDEIAAKFTAGSDFNFSAALEEVWKLINLANKYVEETKPWNLSKENKTKELERFILVLVDAIRAAGHALKPFVPGTAGEILRQIGADQIKKGKPLFPRIECS
ncbi:MAG: methionine--tRNA ligase [Candidatus Omnitrophica bacterium]|nr:methionine--tRNA ligase [Candidatus Omnitrophota bacterium]